MKKNIYKIFLGLPTAFFLFSSCNDEPEPVPAPPAVSSRTVLVYMVADNNLGQSNFDTDDIMEMQESARKGDIPADGRLLVYNDKKTPVLFEITAEGNDTLMTYTASDLSVSASRMSTVLADVRRLAPADSRGLVLWSHGTGWLQDGIAEADYPVNRAFGYQDRKTMNISTLAGVLENSGVFDFIYFDCCYMQSVETLYELRNCAPLFAGSPTELLTSGMPYNENVAEFFALGEPDIIGAATNTFNLYNGKSGQNRTCTMSVVKSSALENLARATAAIYARSGYGLPAGYTPQRFSNVNVSSCNYFDLYDYVRALCYDGTAERFDGSAQLFTAFDTAFNSAIVYSAATPYLWNVVPLDRCNGLSTYILPSSEDAGRFNYRTLQWYDDVASKLN